MSRRITRSQTISLTKPSECVLGLNRKSAQLNKVGKRLTPSNRSASRSSLISADISMSVLKEISNVNEIKPTSPKGKKSYTVDKTQKARTGKSSTTASSKVDNISLTSNSTCTSNDNVKVGFRRRESVAVENLNETTIKSLITAVENVSLTSDLILPSKEIDKVTSLRRKSVEVKKLEANKAKSKTTTSLTYKTLLTSDSILESKEKVQVAPLRRKSVGEKALEATPTQSLATTSSKADHRITSTVISQQKKGKAAEKKVETITKEPPPKTTLAKSGKIIPENTSFTSISTVLPENNVSKNSRRKSVSSVGKPPEVITNEPNSTTSLTKVNEIQHDNASSMSNITDDALEVAAQTSFGFKIPTIPLRRSARISVKLGLTSTQESSQIPTPVQSSKIKDSRCTVHSFPTEVPNAIADTSAAEVNFSTSSARRAVNTRKDENVVKNGKKPHKNSSNAINEIIIPEDLLKVLREDTHIVNGLKKLHIIPAKLNVAKVIEDYSATKHLDEAHSNGFTIEKFLEGIVEYFNVLIGNQLLYELELVQYVEILHKYPDIAMSKVYPPVYLLRLLVRLNILVAGSTQDKEMAQWIISQINDFAKYLAERKSNLFNLRC